MKSPKTLYLYVFWMLFSVSACCKPKPEHTPEVLHYSIELLYLTNSWAGDSSIEGNNPYSLPSQGCVFKIWIRSNIAPEYADYIFTGIGADCSSWIELGRRAKYVSDDLFIIELQAHENTGLEPRSGHITVGLDWALDYDHSIEISFTQAASPQAVDRGLSAF